MTLTRLAISAAFAFSLATGAAAQQPLQILPQKQQPVNPPAAKPSAQNAQPIFKFSGKVKTLDGEIKSITVWEDGKMATRTYKGAHAIFNTGVKVYGYGPDGKQIDTGTVFMRPMSCADMELQGELYAADPLLTRGKPKGTAEATVNEYYNGWTAAGCAEEGRKFPGRETTKPLMN